MWIDSKYLEMYAPGIANFVYIVGNSYMKASIQPMERMTLQKLNFDLSHPLHFLRY